MIGPELFTLLEAAALLGAPTSLNRRRNLWPARKPRHTC